MSSEAARRPLAAVAVVAGLVVAGLFVTDRADAHVGHVILRAERYLKLDATDGDTRLVVSLTLGPDEGRRVLESADADADGEVSMAEADRYLAEWAAGLATEIPVEIDGGAIAVAWTDGWLEPAGPVTRTPLTLELVAHLPTNGREHTITFRDAMVRREVYDRTDVAFRGHDGAELVACGRGESPAEIEEDLALTAGETVDAFSARVRFPDRTWLSTAPPWALGAVVALVVLAIAGTAGARRRRAPTARPSP